jgi:nicotinamide phosphoribosyltransferase
MNNVILSADSYKYSHHKMYPPGTTNMFSYFESRGGRFKDIVFFGLQYYLKQLQGPVVTQQEINRAEELITAHGLSFNKEGWQYILNTHGGKLPVVIRAVKEGTTVPTKNVLFTVESTDPNCFWLSSFLETLLAKVWYPCTVATQSRYAKKAIVEYLEETGTPELADFKLHDFGFRGVSSSESAGIGGLAHLVSFKGTDTVKALEFAQEFYGCSMAGFSIPATEYSTITSWGKDKEVNAYEHLLNEFPKGLVACVSDSYDLMKACRKHWGTTLKDKVLRRDGTLVIRPDSGDPVVTALTTLNILEECFGSTKNSKGYKVLPDQVRIIQGDGIDLQSLYEILYSVKAQGFSIDNLAFGSGGGLLQKLNRDTCKFAYKCSSAIINGSEVDVFKDPITDSGKISKKGKLTLDLVDEGYKTVRITEVKNDQLIEVFRDGKLLVNQSLDEIRAR